MGGVHTDVNSVDRCILLVCREESSGGLRNVVNFSLRIQALRRIAANHFDCDAVKLLVGEPSDVRSKANG